MARACIKHAASTGDRRNLLGAAGLANHRKRWDGRRSESPANWALSQILAQSRRFQLVIRGDGVNCPAHLSI